MGIRAKTEVKSELVIPKIEETSASFNLDVFPEFTVAPPSGGVTLGESKLGGDPNTSQWKEFTLGIDLSGVKEIAVVGENFLKVLNNIVQIQKTLLKILRLFSSDLKSLTRVLKSLIKAVVKNIKAFVDSLLSTGVFVAPVYAEFDETLPGFTLPINGGFGEFKSRINSLCLDRRDPTAPKFGPKDVVGGIIICCGAGTNDPKLLNDMLKNMDILAKFFGFKNPMPAPPRNPMAMAGLYKDETGKYKPGVKITWENPIVGVTGFRIYRCLTYEGSKKTINDDGKVKEIRIYEDKTFNGGEPVEFSAIGSFIKPDYEYIDFEVKEGTTYNYQIFSTAGFDLPKTYKNLRKVTGGLLPVGPDDWLQSLQKVTSPIGSKRVSATPRKCIPMTELKKYLILDRDGNLRDIDKFATGGWLNLTIRDLLGAQMDDILDLLTVFAERISGSLTSAGSALDKYILFLEKKIQNYMEIVSKIRNIVERLMQYRLQGTVLLLNLEAQEGGISGLVNRMQKATIDPQVVLNMIGTKGPESRAQGSLVSNADLTSTVDSLEGIFSGVILVYGYPNFDDETIQSYVPQAEIENYKKQIKQTKKALETYQKILGLKK